jgi:hypothetical protein
VEAIKPHRPFLEDPKNIYYKLKKYYIGEASHRIWAEIAQSVEQWTENPRVDGSIPPLGNLKFR